MRVNDFSGNTRRMLHAASFPFFDIQVGGGHLTRGVLIALFVVVLLGVQGCASRPPDTFILTEPPAVGGQNARNRQLLVAAPSAVKALDGEQIVVRTTQASIRNLSQSRWADRLPALVQDRLIQAFERSGRLGGVGRPGEGLAIDYQLTTSIRSFEIVVAQNRNEALVEISARILDDRNGIVVAQNVFTARAAVSGAGSEASVLALNAAFGQVVSDMVSWTLARM